MSKLIMMIGLPGSGKSTYAKELSVKENAIILSSDELRKELYNNVNDTEHNIEVFQELNKRLRENLLEGKNTIIDATNINSKRRIGLLGQFKGEKFKDLYKECYYMNTTIENVIEQNTLRERKVPIDVIQKMYKTLHVPMYFEGWNKINFISNIENDAYMGILIEPLFTTKMGYEYLFNYLISIDNEFKNIYEKSHDSPYHTLSISRHTYCVYDYLFDNYCGKDKRVMLWAALLHDIGKQICKEYYGRYAKFIGHENVSAQKTINILKALGYDNDFIINVATIVQLHMRLSWDNNEKVDEKFKNLVGEELYNKLKIFREADLQAN